VAGHRSRRAYVRAALRMLRLNIMPRKYDLVHAHTGHCGVLARLQWQYPVLVTYVGYDLNGVRRADGRLTLKSRLERAVFRQLPRSGVATVTMSARLETQLPSRYRSRNAVLQNGVDRSVFRPMPRDVARARTGWPDEELVVLFAADPANAVKRFSLATTAVEIAAAQMPGIRLRVCSGVEH